MQYAGLLHSLAAQARNCVRDIDPQNDLTFLRVRSKKNEIMVAPGMLVYIISTTFNFCLPGQIFRITLSWPQSELLVPVILKSKAFYRPTGLPSCHPTNSDENRLPVTQVNTECQKHELFHNIPLVLANNYAQTRKHVAAKC